MAALFLLAIQWPAPEGWRAETIPFPLEFAPTIMHGGVEEVRFMPGMFNPAAEDFFSYAFAWLIEPDDHVSIRKELPLYFDGLCKAVTKAACKAAVMRGSTITIIEPFKTKKPLTLHVKTRTKQCRDRQAFFFELSPKPSTHDVWIQLDRQVASFDCGDGADIHSCATDADCTISCPTPAGCCSNPCGCMRAINKAFVEQDTRDAAKSCQRPPCPAMGCAYKEAMFAQCREHRCVAQ